MKKKLVLITANFPFGTSETFLESELPILAKNFEDIEIFTFSTKGNRREVPGNCNVNDITISYKNYQSIFKLFSPLFWKEIFIIKNKYKQPLSIGILKTMLISLLRAKKISTFLNSKLEKKEEYIYYSYWCDDNALALSIFNNEKQYTTLSRAHRWDIYFEENTYNYLPFRHFINKKLSKIYFISDDGYNYSTKKWKIHSKIDVSKLGVKKMIRKQELSDINEKITIVSCSNLIQVKRVNLIIETLSLITYKQIHWVHFGDGALEANLKELAEKILPTNITFEWKGRIPNSEVLEYYKESKPSVFINLSSSEGIPVSIMEAMSFGIPCIATDVGGNREIVNQKNGVLIPPDCPINDVKEAILKIIDSSIENQLSFNIEAYATWENNYNSETNYNEFIKSIKNLT